VRYSHPTLIEDPLTRFYNGLIKIANEDGDLGLQNSRAARLEPSKHDLISGSDAEHDKLISSKK